jgi:hypothetical protein
MELSNRTLAAVTTLAMVVLLFAVPSAKSAETDPDKMQDRVSAERFSAPGLIHSASLDANQLTAFGASRANRQDRLVTAATECAGFAWPQVALRCLLSDDGADRSQRQVRTITTERRVGENTSVLVRVPANIAQR